MSRLVLTTVALLSFAGLIVPANGESEASDGVSRCSKELQLPRSGPSLPEGTKSGPMLVTVVPDSLGHPKTVTIEPSSADGAGMARSWIETSKFAPECAGQRLQFSFSFVTEGPPTEYAFTWVTFSSPHHFTIHSTSRTPRVLLPPAKRLQRAKPEAATKVD